LSDVTAFSFSFDFERSTLNTPCWDAPGRIAVRDHNPAGVTKQANDRAEIVSQRFALAFQRFSFPLPGSHHDDVAIWTALQENECSGNAAKSSARIPDWAAVSKIDIFGARIMIEFDL